MNLARLVFALLVATLTLGTVVGLASAEPAAPTSAPACTPASPALPAGIEVAPTLVAIPPVDYILCSCRFCAANPDVDCQVSPTGYSILCSDWYRLHC